MKLPMNLEAGTATDQNRPYRAANEQGSAVIVVLALLALMLIYVTANLRVLHYLGEDIKQVERRQIHRLQAPNPTHTNSIAWTASPSSESH